MSIPIAWSPIYALDLPEGHRFPMAKYNLLPEQLIYEGTLLPSQLFSPRDYPEAVITRVHCENYWTRLKTLSLTKQEIRKTGFPLTHELVERERQIMFGTIDCALCAIESGISLNIAGGTHHAFYDRGEGFCLLNDQCIAAQYLLDKGLARQILVIDLDVHQGNGTASLMGSHKQVYTFSMHGASNYPLQKERSHWDIGLKDGAGDVAYLQQLKTALAWFADNLKPDHIFYQCGVDVLATDKLGRLALTIQGCKERDRMVLEWANERDIPITCSMGGGYSERIADIIEAHANTFRLAQMIFG